MIKDAIISAIERLKKIRLDADPVIHFPSGIWALDRKGRILQDINDHDLEKWFILIIGDENVYHEFQANNWYHLEYPSLDAVYGYSIPPKMKSGIYQAMLNDQFGVYEFVNITEGIKALKSSHMI